MAKEYILLLSLKGSLGTSLAVRWLRLLASTAGDVVQELWVHELWVGWACVSHLTSLICLVLGDFR